MIASCSTPRVLWSQRWLGRCGLLLCVLSSGAAHAQLPFDPAPPEQIRQQERERELRRQQEQSPDVHLPTPMMPGTENIPRFSNKKIPEQESPCFPIQRITLVGDDAESFQFALSVVLSGDDAALDRCLGSEGVNIVLARVQEAILAKGFVTTRVFAAPQDLTTGELVLTVVPGRVREVRFADDASPRGTKWNALPNAPAQLLNLRDIEQGLENFKRVPTAEADIQIESPSAEDAKPGDSDLVVRYQQAFPFRLNLSFDDSGLKSTGKFQRGITVSYDNALTLNDLFYYTSNRGIGGDPGPRSTDGYVAHYSLPFGYWLFSTTMSESNYVQTTAGAFQDIVYSGHSENQEVKISRLVYRDAMRKTTLSLRAYSRASSNYIDDTEVAVQRRRTGGWEAGINHREFIGDSILDSNVGYRRGTGAFGALPAPEEAFGEGTTHLRIVTADINLSIPFTLSTLWGDQQFRYAGNWRGQWSQTALTPQDRFAIGGRYTVRGFDGELTLSAENGWLLRNDLGIALGNSGQELYVGFDQGEISGRAAQTLAGTKLTGIVLGLRGAYKNFSYDTFIGQPVNKPQGFRTPSTIGGFSLNLAF